AGLADTVDIGSDVHSDHERARGDARDAHQRADSDTRGRHNPGAALVASLTERRPAAGMALIDQLLRDYAAVLARIRDQVDMAGLARTMLIAIAASCALFGAALGTYRGGVQIAYAAIKFPLLMLLTAAVCAPGLTAFNAALDRPVSLRRDIATVLCAMALGGLLLVAQAPLVLLAASIDVDYHSIILLTFACSAVAGLGSLVVLARGVRASSAQRAGSAILATIMLFSVVGAQMAWTLRPYVVRPRTVEVPFVRNVEGNLLDAVFTSMDSARGIYAPGSHRSYLADPDFTEPEFTETDFDRDLRPDRQREVAPVEPAAATEVWR
ncbi:MAG: hypothetical protein AAGC55_04910, partial [Myxococcota bacterium]